MLTRTKEYVTHDMPLFILTSQIYTNPGMTQDKITIPDFIHPYSIKFKNKELYQLFKLYLEDTTYIGRDVFYDGSSEVVSLDRLSKNIIGKFLLETDLDWPQKYYDIDKYLQPETKLQCSEFSQYKHKKGEKDVREFTVLIGFTISEDLIFMMNRFAENRQRKKQLNEIKNIAILIAQARRTKPEDGFSFFAQLPEDCVTALATHIAPLQERAGEVLNKAIVTADERREQTTEQNCLIM